MKLLLRIFISIISFVAVFYFIFWLPLSLILKEDSGTYLRPIISVLVAAGAVLFIWKKTRNIGINPNHFGRDAVTYIFLGGFIMGSFSFIAGFFGPMIITPEANQGPLLGIFITGPLGFVLGMIIGGFYWFFKVKKRRNKVEANKSYNEIYSEKEKMFGHPYHELQEYFNSLDKKGTVLDLGCGQGRDAIFLAKNGFPVTAVDSSEVGIRQMLRHAKEQNLQLKGIVSDVLQLELWETFDIILFDMLLHSFDKDRQVEIFSRCNKMLHPSGKYCIVYPEEYNAEYFVDLLNGFSQGWAIEKKITIHDILKLEGEGDYTFEMSIISRIG